MNKSPLKTLKKVASHGDKNSTMGTTTTPRARTSSDGSGLVLDYDSGDEEELDSGADVCLTASMYKRRGGFGRKADNNWYVSKLFSHHLHIPSFFISIEYFLKMKSPIMSIPILIFVLS